MRVLQVAARSGSHTVMGSERVSDLTHTPGPPPWAKSHDRQLGHAGIWDEEGRCVICTVGINDAAVHAEILSCRGYVASVLDREVRDGQ